MQVITACRFRQNIFQRLKNYYIYIFCTLILIWVGGGGGEGFGVVILLPPVGFPLITKKL